MKDITSTSFGLVIAFLLPGLAGLYSLTFWSDTARGIFRRFETAQSDVGLFLLVLLAALMLGLQITVVRWLIFERLISRRERLKSSDFSSLGKNETTLVAFRAAVDEHYRYHQFWGGMTVVIPFAYVGWIVESCDSLMGVVVLLSVAVFGAVEFVTAYAAAHAYQNYVKRAGPIMGGNNAERVEEGGERMAVHNNKGKEESVKKGKEGNQAP